MISMIRALETSVQRTAAAACLLAGLLLAWQAEASDASPNLRRASVELGLASAWSTIRYWVAYHR